MKKLLACSVFAAALVLPATGFAAEAQYTASTANAPISIINLEELEKEVARQVPKGPFGYVQGGAEDEVTLRDNTRSFDSKRILPHGLSGIAAVSLETKFLDIPLRSPIIVAPMAAHGLMHADAEVATAKGAAKAGTILSVSTYATLPIETIARDVPEAPLFVMLYMSKDNGFNEYLLHKAKEAKAKAIILTIDAGTPGNREGDVRNNYQYAVATPNVTNYYKGKTVTQSEARASRKISFTGDDIQYVKKVSGLPVLVKGIMTPEDADAAIKAGADGIWVSNHGGRQLDSAPATFTMLPLIATVVDKRVPIVFDSGVRRGTHVFKALASGADIVAIGRPVLYGLNLGGPEGVKSVFDQLHKELTTTMILAGTKDIAAVQATELFSEQQ